MWPRSSSSDSTLLRARFCIGAGDQRWSCERSTSTVATVSFWWSTAGDVVRLPNMLVLQKLPGNSDEHLSTPQNQPGSPASGFHLPLHLQLEPVRPAAHDHAARRDTLDCERVDVLAFAVERVVDHARLAVGRVQD